MPATQSAPRRRVVLHVGLHKSGTTYLQESLRANAGQVRRQGVFVPEQPGGPSVLRAVDDLQGRRQVRADDARASGAWSAYVAAAHASGLPTVLLSDERLSLSGLPAIRAIGRDFADDDLALVLTVRDLPRTLISSWEEAVRGGATWTWDEYMAAIRDPDRRGINPARGFWVRQDLAGIAAAWESIVSPEAITVVTVPPPSAPSGELLRRFCAAVQLNSETLTRPPRRTNRAIGLAGTEMLRRFNERYGGEFDRRQYDRLVKYLIAPKLADQRGAAPSFSAEDLAWLDEAAAERVGPLQERGYRVLGDIDDLTLPAGATERVEVAEAEVAEAALAALAAVARRQVKAARAAAAGDGGRRKPGGGRRTALSAPSALAGRWRATAFRARRAVLARADRGGPLAVVVARAYRLRERRQAWAMRAARRRRG